MNEDIVISKTKEYVRNILEKEGTGHDWFHIQRVCKTAIYIANEEKADLFIVQLSALLHEIGDRKITGLDETTSDSAKRFLEQLGMEKDAIKKICHIINNISFSKNIDSRKDLSL